MRLLAFLGLLIICFPFSASAQSVRDAGQFSDRMDIPAYFQKTANALKCSKLLPFPESNAKRGTYIFVPEDDDATNWSMRLSVTVVPVSMKAKDVDEKLMSIQKNYFKSFIVQETHFYVQEPAINHIDAVVMYMEHVSGTMEQQNLILSVSGLFVPEKIIVADLQLRRVPPDGSHRDAMRQLAIDIAGSENEVGKKKSPALMKRR